MHFTTHVRFLLVAMLAFVCGPFAGTGWAQSTGGLAPSIYVADFVSPAATGSAMNNAGDVAGTSYRDPGCGPFCLPVQDTVVWRGGVRIVLPTVPGLLGIYVQSINAQGWVAGFAGFPGTTTHAVVWKPNGNTYDAIDLGNLPGKTISTAVGIDDLGRVVGWSTTQFFPPSGAPFLWTEAGGMVDLTSMGFPADMPIAISPGGTVGTAGSWYGLDDPASVVLLPPAPRGFVIGADGFKINDAGDQGRFLITTSGENLLYLFRFHHEGVGTWQQISSVPTGHLTTAGVGSINDAGDISATVAGTGMVAYGPDGMAQSLALSLSPAYKGAALTSSGPMNKSGKILARVLIGNSSRLMRLVPAVGCTAGCIRANQMQIVGKFIEDPKDPGHCTLDAKNRVQVKLQVTNEAGGKLSGVSVKGRFLDDYWMNKPVSGTTDLQGVVVFSHEGLACVGAVAFLVDNAKKGTQVLDRTTGILTGSVIPLP